MVNKIKRYYYGIIARVLDFFIPIHTKTWIFGSDVGRSYREWSKYLLGFLFYT